MLKLCGKEVAPQYRDDGIPPSPARHRLPLGFQWVKCVEILFTVVVDAHKKTRALGKDGDHSDFFGRQDNRLLTQFDDPLLLDCPCRDFLISLMFVREGTPCIISPHRKSSDQSAVSFFGTASCKA